MNLDGGPLRFANTIFTSPAGDPNAFLTSAAYNCLRDAFRTCRRRTANAWIDKSVRILVIEDDEVIAERVKAGLEKAGFDVDTAADGEDGLLRARRDAYALIVLDLMLPKRDGWKVCEALR